jgi:putative drug exporter of the RND superfamily
VTPSPPPAARPARSRFARIAHWCATHRALTIVAWLLTAVVVTFAAQAAGTKEIASFRLPGTESQRVYDLLADRFPAQNGDSDQIVFRARTGTLRDGEARAGVESALRGVRRQGIVANVSDPLAEGGRLTPDGRTGVAEVLYRGSINDFTVDELTAVEDAAFAGRRAVLQVEHGGFGAQIVRQGGGGPSEFIGILAAAVVLLITFGSVVAAGLPLVTAIFALVTTLGGIALLSHVVDTPDFAAQLASLIGLGVGIDYALFVLTRYRNELRAGSDRLTAIEDAIDTAGRTVFFAGCTVIIALLGLLLLGLNFMQGVAVGAALAVLLTMVGALTLLPALLSLAGRFIEPRRRRKAAQQGRRPKEGVMWERWSRAVQRRPVPAALIAFAVLLALAAPALGLRLGSSDASLDPPGTTTRKAYDLISQGFGPGVNGTFLLAAELPKAGDAGPARAIAAAVGRDPGILAVSPPQLSPDGSVATLSAVPRSGPQARATAATLNRLRDDVLPEARRATRVRTSVGGTTASQEDFTDVVASKLPLFVGVVVVLSALLLLAVFRSVLIPVKAAIMNLLSIGAALGVVTAVFQNGVGADLLGIGTGPIESFLPVLLFAIVFGLSMDYEIFLISRVHEEWERSGDASGSVARGLATTGKVITAAASIMVVVFASFALGDDRIIKLFGIGLASAILLDAVIIRCLLVPAIMELLGRRAWWLPPWLDRVVPRLALEREPVEPAPEPARATV